MTLGEKTTKPGFLVSWVGREGQMLTVMLRLWLKNWESYHTEVSTVHLVQCHVTPCSRRLVTRLLGSCVARPQRESAALQGGLVKPGSCLSPASVKCLFLMDLTLWLVENWTVWNTRQRTRGEGRKDGVTSLCLSELSGLSTVLCATGKQALP